MKHMLYQINALFLHHIHVFYPCKMHPKKCEDYDKFLKICYIIVSLRWHTDNFQVALSKAYFQNVDEFLSYRNDILYRHTHYWWLNTL